jgi:hypothetical protein
MAQMRTSDFAVAKTVFDPTSADGGPAHRDRPNRGRKAKSSFRIHRDPNRFLAASLTGV